MTDAVLSIAAATKRPEHVVGLHFFNPVHIMKLVEVVWGPETSDHTRDTAVAFARRLGKEPIVVKDAPGFASSRLGIVLGMEAIREFEIKDMPVTVAVDSRGESVHKSGPAEWRIKIANL